MKKLAFVFPGQGSQFVSMARDFYDLDFKWASYFDRANDLLDYDLKNIIFDGPDYDLMQTLNAQPAIVLVSSLIFDFFVDLLKRNNLFEPDSFLVAGHSLGEFTAFYASCVFDFENLITIIKNRASIMHDIALDSDGMMLAIIGADLENVYKICDKASLYGKIFPANFNSFEQIVLSGEKKAIDYAMKVAKDFGAKVAKPLNVTAAFHSPLMARAADRFSVFVDNLHLSSPCIDLVSNVTARKVLFEDIKDNIKKHMLSAVYWQKSVSYMIDLGVETFIEVGPGKVLQRLIKKINKHVNVFGIDNVDSAYKIFDYIKANDNLRS